MQILTRYICLLWFTILAIPSSYAICESGHWVQDKTDDGSVIILEDGSKWLVNFIDRTDTSLWLATDNITACAAEGYLINTDQNPPETAHVTAIN